MIAERGATAGRHRPVSRLWSTSPPIRPRTPVWSWRESMVGVPNPLAGISLWGRAPRSSGSRRCGNGRHICGRTAVEEVARQNGNRHPPSDDTPNRLPDDRGHWCRLAGFRHHARPPVWPGATVHASGSGRDGRLLDKVIPRVVPVVGSCACRDGRVGGGRRTTNPPAPLYGSVVLAGSVFA